MVAKVEGRQIGLDGVAHGEKYTVTFRRGLPALSGEKLHKDVTLTLYVRDRAPSARFAGRGYVLPRTAGAALPVRTLNVGPLDLTLCQISDRNVMRALRERLFARPLARYEMRAFESDLAQEIWNGTATVQNTLNVEMTTRLPLSAPLSGRPPGLYALRALVPGQDKNAAPATLQWFMLSDLGASSWSGVNGLHVAVRI
ncbi:MAG: hypothetical protein AAF943_00835 [Pseudomonadota bacterium]